MSTRRRIPTADQMGDQFRLALARDLERVYSDLLHEPVPEDLRKLVDRLDEATPDPPAEPKKNVWWRALRRRHGFF